MKELKENMALSIYQICFKSVFGCNVAIRLKNKITTSPYSRTKILFLVMAGSFSLLTCCRS